jgi:hypothetical protein
MQAFFKVLPPVKRLKIFVETFVFWPVKALVSGGERKQKS